MFTFAISTRVSAAAGSWDSTGSTGITGAEADPGNWAAGFGLLLLELQEARNIAAAANSMCRIAPWARRPIQLLFDYLFNLADFLLDFAGEVFVLAFGLQVRVAYNLSHFLFDLTFHLVKVAFNLVRRARFHLFSPRFRFG